MSEPKLLFCGVRDGGDFWHLECRFEDGQKFAAVQVDKGHERLADEIAAYLNSGHDGVLSGEDARKLLSSLGDVANPDEIAARRVVSRERLTKIEGRADNRKASEQALGLAEIRIRQLGEQLVACDKALAERDARILVLTRDAGRLADEVDVLIRTRVIDSRSPAADALLDFREPPSTPRSDRLAKLDKIVWGLVHNAGRCITSGRVPRGGPRRAGWPRGFVWWVWRGRLPRLYVRRREPATLHARGSLHHGGRVATSSSSAGSPAGCLWESRHRAAGSGLPPPAPAGPPRRPRAADTAPTGRSSPGVGRCGASPPR